MSYICWGGFNSGKRHLNILCKANQKSISKFGQRNFTKEFVHQSTSTFQQYTNDGKKLVIDEKVHHDYNSARSIANGGPGEDYLFSNKGPQVFLPKTKYEKLSRSHLKNVFDDFINVDMFMDCGLLINLPDHIFTQYKSSYFDLKRAILDEVIEDEVTEHIRTRHSIFPYKTNILDCLKSRIWMYPYDGPLHDFVCFLNENKTKIYSYLNDNIRQSRLIEQTLLKYRLDVEYFDLDTDSYLNTFRFVQDAPRTMTKVDLTDDAPIDEVNQYISDYIQIQKVTDLTIKGIKTDGLSYAKQ